MVFFLKDLFKDRSVTGMGWYFSRISPFVRDGGLRASRLAERRSGCMSAVWYGEWTLSIPPSSYSWFCFGRSMLVMLGEVILLNWCDLFLTILVLFVLLGRHAHLTETSPQNPYTTSGFPILTPYTPYYISIRTKSNAQLCPLSVFYLHSANTV